MDVVACHEAADMGTQQHQPGLKSFNSDQNAREPTGQRKYNVLRQHMRQIHCQEAMQLQRFAHNQEVDGNIGWSHLQMHA